MISVGALVALAVGLVARRQIHPSILGLGRFLDLLKDLSLAIVAESCASGAYIWPALALALAVRLLALGLASRMS